MTRLILFLEEMTMNELTVKQVDLFGDTIMAAQDKDGNIWAGVKWLCEGLGLSEGQTKSERKKIQEDMVLSEGTKFHPLGNSNAGKDVLCLNIDFIPLWLAKISITPSMKENNPELVDKLVKYQLKAKDVLAEAFIQKPKSSAEILLMYAQQFYEQEQRMSAIEDDMRKLEAKITTHDDNYFTIAGYASLRGLNINVNLANMLGRKASKLSKEYGYDISKTKDPRFGTVNMYHTDILGEVFQHIH